MSRHEVVIALFTIVYGLMLTELFLSVHRLIRRRAVVHWHWLPLAAAWYLFLTILKNWWDLALVQYDGNWMNIFFFLAYGHLLVLIYFSVSAVLPDEVPADGLDLQVYYFEVHRYFWGLISAVVAVSVAIGSLKQAQVQGQVNIANLLGNGVFLIFTLILAWVRRPRIHSVLLVLLVALILLEIVGKGLGS